MEKFYNQFGKSPLDEFPELQKCIDGGAINAVKNAISIGNILHGIKTTIKERKESWLDFMKENFSISIRACQNYMQLAKTPIHENHYKLGTEGLLLAIRTGYDLSNSWLDPFVCSECGYGPWDGCDCPLFFNERRKK